MNRLITSVIIVCLLLDSTNMDLLLQLVYAKDYNTKSFPIRNKQKLKISKKKFKHWNFKVIIIKLPILHYQNHLKLMILKHVYQEKSIQNNIINFFKKNYNYKNLATISSVFGHSINPSVCIEPSFRAPTPCVDCVTLKKNKLKLKFCFSFYI